MGSGCSSSIFFCSNPENEGEASKLLKNIEGKFKEATQAGEDAVWKIVRTIEPKHHKETCIKGIYSYNGVHEDLTMIFHTDLLGEVKTLLKTTSGKSTFDKCTSKDKKTLARFQEIWKVIQKDLHDDVQFPEKLDGDQLRNLIAHNPFFTMGLSTETGPGGKVQLCWDASPSSENPITASVMSALDYKTRAKLWISENLQHLSLEVGGEVYDSQENAEEFDKHLVAFMTPLLYFFEVCHATLHVYTYIMLGAANTATFGTEMYDFVKQYEPNIFVKYQEVALLLFNKKDGLLCGQAWNPVDYDQCMKAAKDVFELYAGQSSAQEWFENVFCAGNKLIFRNELLLPQARNYVPVFKKLSNGAIEKLRQKLDEHYFQSMAGVNEKLLTYLSKTDGADSAATMFTMHDFENWVECQGMAGILHGNTLSFTRLIFTKYCQFGGDWQSEYFDPKFNASAAAVGTLMGLEEEHAINQAEPVEHTEFYDMMKSLEALTADMQQDFWKNLTPSEKEQFTWVLSVWGPNMLDQTQLTISTYV